MPQIRMLGIPMNVASDAADPITAAVVELTGCPPVDVVVSRVELQTLRGGRVVEHPPIVEVWWFDRGPAVQGDAAQAITAILQERGIGSVDVVFNLYEPERYYENGKSF